MSGGTGSGKTTQIPKYVLGSDLPHLHGKRKIAVTQPRSIVTLEVSKRLAEELDTRLGDYVGYSMPQDRLMGLETVIQFLTAGVLLQQAFVREYGLSQSYSTIIIDEAHEQSITTDILFSKLKHLLSSSESALKLVIMSATLNAESFRAFYPGSVIFNIDGGTPRLVSTSYIPQRSTNMISCMIQLIHHILRLEDCGDILVFLPGESEIQEAGVAIRNVFQDKMKIWQLFSEMSMQKQRAVLESHLHKDRMRIILATNIAETSLTVNDIVHVIDSCVVMMEIYDPVAQCTSLFPTAVSKSAARQRAGRVGRTQPRHCWRMCTPQAYLGLNEFTTPLIVRSRLALIILGLRSAGSTRYTPFESLDLLDKPSKDQIAGAYVDLRILGLIEGPPLHQITQLGSDCIVLGCGLEIAITILTGRAFGCEESVISLAVMLEMSSIVSPYEYKPSVLNMVASLYRPFLYGDMLHLIDISRPYTQSGPNRKKKIDLSERLETLARRPRYQFTSIIAEKVVGAILKGFGLMIAVGRPESLDLRNKN